MSGSLQENPFHRVGFWSVLAGAFGLMMVFVQIVGPTLEPQPSVGSQIGEIAGDIGRSAWQSFRGEYVPEPEPVSGRFWNILGLFAPILGIVAIVLSVISAVRRENWHYAFYGAGLGASAVVFYFFWWVALLICGVFLLVAIIENLGSIFDGGLFGG